MNIQANPMLQRIKNEIYGVVVYAYFAPIIAIKVCFKKGGNYFTHIFALHRLARWQCYKI